MRKVCSRQWNHVTHVLVCAALAIALSIGVGQLAAAERAQGVNAVREPGGAQRKPAHRRKVWVQTERTKPRQRGFWWLEAPLPNGDPVGRA